MKKRLNIFYWLRKLFVSNLFQKFFHKKNFLRKIIFYTIYKSNHWNRYAELDKNNLLVSGPGSVPGIPSTINLVKNLKNFIRDNNIKSILDIPCGDFAWFKDLVINENINYMGWDIVKDIIEYNNKKYKSKNINFLLKDILLESDFDNHDLIFSRDFFIHIRINEIKKILDNIKKSNSKFFACSNNYDVKSNNDILIGQHRKVNLFMEPFNLKSPYLSFYEGTEDCYIDIFKVSDL